MAAYEVLLLNTTVPQIQAAQSGDTYVVPRDIAFSAVANLANGTYLLPALAFSSDPDTGIFRQGANQLGFTAGGGTDQMVLTSTGLGIGTSSPSAKLDVAGTSAKLANNTSADVTVLIGPDTPNAARSGRIGLITSSSQKNWYVANSWNVSGALEFTQTTAAGGSTMSGTPSMLLDSSGNLGLGVTPSAWVGRIVSQVYSASIASPSGSPAISEYSTNRYLASGGVDRYIYSAAATVYQHDTGAHKWFTAPSGTAGNAITFSQVMTLDASGNLLVGRTSGVYRLDVAYATAGEIARFSYTGGSKSPFIGAIAQSDTLMFLDAQNSDNTVALGIRVSGSERARITSGGDFQTASGNSVMVGGTAARATTAGTNRVDIFDGTAPVGTLANGVSFYSASGEANVMDAAGNATLLSPHDAETNEWIFRSKHTPSGKVLKIDVERLLKFVNDHFGLDAVHEFIEE